MFYFETITIQYFKHLDRSKRTVLDHPTLSLVDPAADNERNKATITKSSLKMACSRRVLSL